MRRIRGARDLVFDGVEAITNLVQRTHREVSQRWTDRVSLVPPVAPFAKSVNAIQLTTADASYATVRLVSRGVSTIVNAVTEPMLRGEHDALATPMREDARGSLPWWIDQAEGTLNAFVGDHLSRQDNGLDLGMTLRHEGRVVPLTRDGFAAALPAPTRKLCVFVHGLAATEWSWVIFADRVWGDSTSCYGSKLSQDLGITPLYVRYNSGLPIADNGRALSRLLETLREVYPVPVEELSLVGHSMGGLVTRAAAHAGDGARWRSALRRVFCIGSPHFGAPLAKGTDLLTRVLRHVPAAGATVPAAVMDARSAAIKNLRDGCDAPLVKGVSYCAVAATITSDPDHPAGVLLGDLLVRRASALADEGDRTRFDSRQVFAGMNHLQLANHPAVYRLLRREMARPVRPA